MSVISGSLGAGLSFWFAVEAAEARLEAALVTRPSIAVIDYRPVAEALASGYQPEAIAPVFEDLKRQAGLLSAAGVLVINRASVEEAPPRLLVTTERRPDGVPRGVETAGQGTLPEGAPPAGGAPIGAGDVVEFLRQPQ